MMRIYDGRDSFYQWDINQKITSAAFKVGDEIHFFNMAQPTALVVVAYEHDGKVVANVPNILLQYSYPINAWHYVTDGNGAKTIREAVFGVTQRAKPGDYFYTETELYTITTAVNKALDDAKNSGEFKGDKGDPGEKGDPGDPGKDGKDGADGYTPQKGIDYWTADEQREIDNHIAEEIAALGDYNTIVPTAKGEAILLIDSAAQKLCGLKLYGKSTQDGTPSPENPVPIVSAGADGEIGVKVCGKNLANPADVYIQLEPSMASVGQVGTVITMTTSNYGEAFHFCEGALKAGKMYTISGNGANVGNIRIYDVTTPGNFIQRKIIELDSAGNFCCEYTPATDNETVRVWINRGEIGELSNFQVEDGTKTDYEPYRGNTLTALTPNGLHEGDYIDLATGVKARWKNTIVFDGVNTTLSSPTVIGDYTRCYYKITDATLHGKSTDSKGFYSHGNWQFSWASDTSHAYVQKDAVWVFLPTGVDPAEYLNAQYEAGTPVTLEYWLEIPIEAPLTEEEMAQFAALETYYPTTTIFNDGGANMEVSYMADTKNYIDKKFNELAAAIVANP